MATSIFDHAHSKIIEITFSFPESPLASKKSVHSIISFLRYSQIYSHVPRLATPISYLSYHTHPKISWSTLNLFEFVLTWKKSGYFIDLFWRYGLLKNPAIWLVENILAYVSGTKFFPNMGFVQEHSKQYKFSLQNKFSKN